MKKSTICMLFATLLILTLAGCGKKTRTETKVFPIPTSSAAPTASAELTTSPSPIPTPQSTRTPRPEITPMALTTVTPVPVVSATPIPVASATPAALAAERINAPVISKQPNSETHFIGESAVFIVSATNWDSLSWTAVSPGNREVDLKTFRETFPDCSVIGEKDTTLTITNISIDMSGWSFYCTFENENAKTKTTSARLRVRDPDNPATFATGTGSAAAITARSKRLRCPSCGSEVPRDLLTCPYCGKEIYTAINKDAYVDQDSTGDILYMDNTGVMYYDSSNRTSTYMDTSTNYAVFNDAGAVQFGNYNKEQEEAEEAELMQEILNGNIDAALALQSRLQ